jgi:hypothetical protein
MMNANELRPGNYILQKLNNRIVPVRCNHQHFYLLEKENSKDIYPVVLKPEILQSCGFVENQDYPLLPDAREFVLVIPVIGSNNNEIRAYIKNNKECFGRAMINSLPASNNFYHLHQLQNLYFALTNKELDVKM